MGTPIVNSEVAQHKSHVHICSVVDTRQACTKQTSNITQTLSAALDTQHVLLKIQLLKYYNDFMAVFEKSMISRYIQYHGTD